MCSQSIYKELVGEYGLTIVSDSLSFGHQGLWYIIVDSLPFTWVSFASSSLLQMQSLLLPRTIAIAVASKRDRLLCENRKRVCHQMLVSRPVVRPLGRNLITVSNSLSMCVFACEFS